MRFNFLASPVWASVFVSLACLGAVSVAGEDRMACADFALATICTRQASDHDLVQAIVSLRRNSQQQAAFLDALGQACRDNRFPPLHRRRCLLQLIALSTKRDERLADLAKAFRAGGIPSQECEISDGWGFSRNVPELLDGDWMKDTILTLCLHLPEKDETAVSFRIEGSHSIAALREALASPSGLLGSTLVKRVVVQPTDVIDELLLKF